MGGVDHHIDDVIRRSLRIGHLESLLTNLFVYE